MAVASRGKGTTVSLFALIAWASLQGKGAEMMDESGDKQKAAALVRSYGRHLGAAVTELDADNDRSFGNSGLHYDGTRRVLIGRVFIVKLNSHLMKPELVKRARQAMAELNGPKIIPLFERVGGRFEFNQSKDILFLTKEFPLQSITERQLRDQMEELSDVAAKWVFRWFGWASQILYGQAQPPGAPLPVTRANDAQHTEFRR